MEEKKLDINSIIGFVLIFGILLWMLYNNRPTPEELEAQEKAKQEQVELEEKEAAAKDEFVTTPEDFIAEDTPVELSTPKKNAMDIASIVGVLIKAIQQLEARIKELESK